jgi:hypothetical protein
MRIEKIDRTYGTESHNRIDDAGDRSIEGALASLETFYYAFNNRDIDVFRQLWLDDELILLNNPLGGMIHGISPIVSMYDRIFNGRAKVWVELTDIVCYQSNKMTVFAGREVGEFSIDGEVIDLQIRTTRVFGYSEREQQWLQIHHHGSIDDAALLERYQQAVRK